MDRLIMVVDDDPDVRTVLSLRLSRAGFQVVTAANGADGLKLMREQHPCGVLLDLTMPVMDGFAFLAALPQQHTNPPPVFVVTQRDDPETRRRVRQLGAIDLFNKSDAMQGKFLTSLRERLKLRERGRGRGRGPGSTKIDKE